MKDVKIQWHSAFVSAMNLELAENRDALIYEKEFNLNTKPLIVDLLVIKKDNRIQISNEIGKLFRGHNIIEYKSPQAHLDIDTFYKASAYASLYKSYGNTLNERSAEDITVSIVRESKPHGLFRFFSNHDIQFTNPFQGIYYILDHVLFPTQIVVTKELSKAGHTWLKALSANLSKPDIESLLSKIDSLKSNFDKQLADSVLEVCVTANKPTIESLKGDGNMCQALLEIMEPEINKIKEALTESVTKSVTKSVKETEVSYAVKSFRDFGIDDLRIRETLIRNFNLSPEEADTFLYCTTDNRSVTNYTEV